MKKAQKTEIITLYTKDGSEEVESLEVPVPQEKADIIEWQDRLFIWKNTEQKYCEAIVQTLEEVEPDDEEEPTDD